MWAAAKSQLKSPGKGEQWREPTRERNTEQQRNGPTRKQECEDMLDKHFST